MSKIPNEIFKSFDIDAAHVTFVNPKKVVVRYDDGKDEIRENVTSISFMMMKGSELPSIEINYKTDNGDGSVMASLDTFNEILVLD